MRLDRLPAASHYWEAVAGDEEIAEARAGAKQEARGRPVPKLSDFNPVVAELAVVSDLLGSVLSVLTLGPVQAGAASSSGDGVGACGRTSAGGSFEGA